MAEPHFSTIKHPPQALRNGLIANWEFPDSHTPRSFLGTDPTCDAEGRLKESFRIAQHLPQDLLSLLDRPLSSAWFWRRVWQVEARKKPRMVCSASI